MACCCTDSPPVAPSDITRTPWRRRVATLVQWAVPLTTLALIPKCPLCVAAYVLLFTGVGMSLPAATGVRGGLIALSIASLAFLLLRAARRAFMPGTRFAPGQ